MPISTRFSKPVSNPSTAANCPVTPIAARTASGSLASSFPAIQAWPASGLLSVDRMRTVVVFPAPFGPSNEKTVPSLMSRSMPSSTSLSLNDFRNPRTAIAEDGVLMSFVPFK